MVPSVDFSVLSELVQPSTSFGTNKQIISIMIEHVQLII